MRSKKTYEPKSAVVSKTFINRKRQLERAAEAIDNVLLSAAIANNPGAAPFLFTRWERIRGLTPDDID